MPGALDARPCPDSVSGENENCLNVTCCSPDKLRYRSWVCRSQRQENVSYTNFARHERPCMLQKTNRVEGLQRICYGGMRSADQEGWREFLLIINSNKGVALRKNMKRKLGGRGAACGRLRQPPVPVRQPSTSSTSRQSSSLRASKRSNFACCIWLLNRSME